MISKFARTSLCLCSSMIFLTGCPAMQDIYGPSGLPRGYAHTHHEYKTIQPDRPFFIGDEYSDEEAKESEALWTAAANKLLNELESKAVIQGLSVSLQPSEPDNSFEVRMDYYLRKALRDRGYMIVTDSPETLPVLRYSGRYPGDPGQIGYAHSEKSTADLGLNGEKSMYDYGPGEFYQLKEKQTPIFLGLGIYDPTLPKREQLLHFTEISHEILTKDLREMRGYISNQFSIYGQKPTDE